MMSRYLVRTLCAVSACALAACSGGSHTVLPATAQSHHIAASGAGNGVAAPVANPTQLQFTSLGAASAKTFTVSVQFAGDLTAASSNTNVATVSPSAASPAVTPAGGGSKSGTFTVTPAGAGTATITVTDKKGETATVTVTVTLPAPYILVAPGQEEANCGAPSPCMITDNNEIDVLDGSASGFVQPLYHGAKSEIAGPSMTIADDGTVWVANSMQGAAPIVQFPSISSLWSTGNLAPLRTIGGSNTMTSGASAIALDGNENIYVKGSQGILRFAAGSSGNVAPQAAFPYGSNTPLYNVADIAVTHDGTLYAGNIEASPTGLGDVVAYAPGASGSSAPQTTIAGSNTHIGYVTSIAVDGSNRLYVLTSDNASSAFFQGANQQPNVALNPRILVFAPGAQGNASPIAIIQGSATGLTAPRQIRADASGGVYVSDYGAHGLYYFAPGANGNVAPARTITTTLSQTYGFSTIGL